MADYALRNTVIACFAVGFMLGISGAPWWVIVVAVVLVGLATPLVEKTLR